MTQPGCLHLVIGSTGAGKSTYARTLAERRSATRFAIDEWMESLFFADRPDDAASDWYMDRIERATRVIWDVAQRLIHLGVDVVLEIGMTQRKARAAFYDKVRAAKARLVLHVLEAPPEIRWSRVEERNQTRGETYSMHVTRGMFDFVETMWEPPDADERAAWNAVVVDTSAPPD